ncbi:MAG: BamA/TamA family outer membrane protein [Chitinispirillia bacterium]|nr:BamA/TamA family outer membrane protein [Chitinispirillia bacterium]
MVFFQKINSKSVRAGFTPAGMTTLLFFILFFCTTAGAGFTPARAPVHDHTEIESSQERWYVSAVHFTGNVAIGNLDLLRAMRTRPPRTFFPMRFDLFVLDEDLERIEILYSNRGYPFARASIEEIERISKRRRVNITINIDEGELIVVDTLVFFHSNVITADELEKFTELLPDKPLDLQMIHSDNRSIRDALRDMGYLQVKVYSKEVINREQGTAKVIHTIEEGPLIKAGALSISGLRRVRALVVRREVTFDSGTVLTNTQLNRTLGNIYSTALFNYVKITPDTTGKSMAVDTAVLPVNINVKETPPYSFQIGVGYESHDRTFLNGDAEYGNLWGIGHRISISGYASEPHQRIQLTYSWPWFLHRQLWSNYSVFADKRDDEFFKGTSEGAIIALRRQITPDWIYNLWTTIERARYDRINIPEERLESRPISTNQLWGFALVNDTRKTMFFPGLSRYGLIQAEIAGITGIGNKYTRLILDFRGYLPFHNNKCLISAAIYSAAAVPYGEDTQVPIRERFRVGEPPSRDLRGFNMRDLSIVAGNDTLAVGGDFILIVNLLEFNYYLTANFMVSIFSDAGFLWENVSSRSPGVLSAGAGIRHSLPIGLLRIDYGIPIEPRISNNSSGRLYLSLRLPF